MLQHIAPYHKHLLRKCVANSVAFSRNRRPHSS